MERGTTLFLKLTVIVMGLPVLAFGVLALPRITAEAADYFPSYAAYAVSALMYASAIPFYAALYQAFRLLSYIDKNQAFSDLSVTALKNIKWCAGAICVLYAASLPFLFIMAEFDDAPGLVGVGVFPGFASMVIGVFAAVLQRLLKSAIDIKTENDLTV